VQPIGVTLVHLPRMLQGIIEAMIDDLPDVTIAANDSPDVAIVSCAQPESFEATLPLLERHPRSRVIAIAPDGRRAFVHELRPVRSEIVDVSPSALLGVIRGERS
jgi:hypothetical protein